MAEAEVLLRKLTRRDLDRLETNAAKAVAFLETLVVPEGPRAGERLRLAPFQRQFVEGSLDPAVDLAALSVGRGNAKSALSADIALGALLGIWDRQPRRDVIIAGRTRDQARVAWNFAQAFCTSLPDDMQRQIIFRRSPRLEIAYEGDGGDHVLRAVPIVTFGVVILLGMASAWADGDMQQPVDSGTAVTTAATGDASH